MTNGDETYYTVWDEASAALVSGGYYGTVCSADARNGWDKVAYSCGIVAGQALGFAWEFHQRLSYAGRSHIRVGLQSASSTGDALYYTGDQFLLDQIPVDHHFMTHAFYVRPSMFSGGFGDIILAQGQKYTIFCADGPHEHWLTNSLSSALPACGYASETDFTAPFPWQFYLFLEDKGTYALVRYKVERPDGSTYLDVQGEEPLYYPYRFAVQPYSDYCAHKLAVVIERLDGEAIWVQRNNQATCLNHKLPSPPPPSPSPPPPPPSPSPPPPSPSPPPLTSIKALTPAAAWIQGGSMWSYGARDGTVCSTDAANGWGKVAYSAEIAAGQALGFAWEFYQTSHIRVGLRSASSTGDARVAYSPYTGESAPMDHTWMTHAFYVRPSHGLSWLGFGDIHLSDGFHECPTGSCGGSACDECTIGYYRIFCADGVRDWRRAACDADTQQDYTAPFPWQFYLFLEDKGTYALVRYKVERPDGSTYLEVRGGEPLYYPYRFAVQPYNDNCAHQLAALGGTASWGPAPP